MQPASLSALAMCENKSAVPNSFILCSRDGDDYTRYSIISAQRTLYPTNIVSVLNRILFQYEIVETECSSRKFNLVILLCILLHLAEYLKVLSFS